MSRFLIQVVEAETGQIARTFEPGQKAEQEFVLALADAIGAQSVGVFRTKAQVREVVISTVSTLLFDLKKTVNPF